MHTPWGKSDYQKEYGNGIVFYGTPSHGGFKLNEERLKSINPAAFTCGKSEYFRNNRKNGWFEEDCDWSFVALAYPELFKPEDIEHAKTILTGCYKIA